MILRRKEILLSKIMQNKKKPEYPGYLLGPLITIWVSCDIFHFVTGWQ